MKNTIIIILFVLVLGLGGYLVYDKFFVSFHDNKIVNNCSSKLIKNSSGDYINNFYQNLKNNRKVTVDYDHGLEVVMDKEGNIYYKADVVKPNDEKKKYSIEGYDAGIDESGNMSNVLDGYKLNISDVVMFFHGITGNGGWQDYIFIKSDGTIGKLTYEKTLTNKISIIKFEETVSGYTNIVGIQTSSTWDAHGYQLIDINGNKY